MRILSGLVFVASGLALMATSKGGRYPSSNEISAWQVSCELPSDCGTLVKLLERKSLVSDEGIGQVSDPTTADGLLLFTDEVIYSKELAEAILSSGEKAAVFDLSDERLVEAGLLRIALASDSDSRCEDWAGYRFCQVILENSQQGELGVYRCDGQGNDPEALAEQSVIWRDNDRWFVFYKQLNLSPDTFSFFDESGALLSFRTEDISDQVDYGFEFVFDEPDALPVRVEVPSENKICTLKNDIEVVFVQ